MPQITFTQPLPLYLLLSLVIAVALFFFVYRFRNLFRPLSRKGPGFEGLPTVLIAGVPRAGKSTLFRQFTQDGISASDGAYLPKQVNLSQIPATPLQFVDMDKKISNEDFDRLKERGDFIVFLFDSSPEALPVQTQLNLLDWVWSKNTPVLPLINLKDEVDEGKIEEIKHKLSKDIPKISLKREGREFLEKVLSRYFTEGKKFI